MLSTIIQYTLSFIAHGQMPYLQNIEMSNIQCHSVERQVANVGGLYSIRIQSYELDEKVNEEFVFIVQLKFNRNVRSGINPMTGPMGISLYGDRPTMGGLGGFGGPMDFHNPRGDPQQQKWRKRCSKSFFDQIWLQHKSKKLLMATVKIINRTIDCEDFVQYNRHTNQFEFKFEKKQNKIKISKSLSLARNKYSMQEAKKIMKRRTTDGRWTEPPLKPEDVDIRPENEADIDSVTYDFTITLTLLPS